MFGIICVVGGVEMKRVYMCIDLKSFYASVECVERNLDPLKTNLVVADSSRTEKTICLAVSPSLKEYGIGGRARLFEVVQRVKEVNKDRKRKIKGKFVGKSYDADILNSNPNVELDYIVAKPRMHHYMKYSTDIYNIYLKYLAPEDIYVYSIDEVFCDITNYLKMYKKKPRDLVTMIIKDVYDTTGITATAGIGTNLYLAKIAMDIIAKHVEPNDFGVRIAELNEMNYRKYLWNYRPITKFWRVGPGIAKRLEKYNMYTMGDVARMSINNEDVLYKLLGINAELLIDHAWGWEPVTMKDIKSFKPSVNSISSGQVLHEPYDYDKTRLIVREMADLLSLDLVEKHIVTNQLVLTIGYDIENLINPYYSNKYFGEVVTDHYGRKVPKHSHGTINLDHKTSSSTVIIENILKLFDRIVNKDLLTRRINITACNVVSEKLAKDEVILEQFDLFTDFEKIDREREVIKEKEEQERNLQRVILDIKNKYGKNAILKAMNLEEGGTTINRNKQVGGHSG